MFKEKYLIFRGLEGERIHVEKPKPLPDRTAILEDTADYAAGKVEEDAAIYDLTISTLEKTGQSRQDIEDLLNDATDPFIADVLDIMEDLKEGRITYLKLNSRNELVFQYLNGEIGTFEKIRIFQKWKYIYKTLSEIAGKYRKGLEIALENRTPEVMNAIEDLARYGEFATLSKYKIIEELKKLQAGSPVSELFKTEDQEQELTDEEKMAKISVPIPPELENASQEEKDRYVKSVREKVITTDKVEEYKKSIEEYDEFEKMLVRKEDSHHLVNPEITPENFTDFQEKLTTLMEDLAAKDPELGKINQSISESLLTIEEIIASGDSLEDKASQLIEILGENNPFEDIERRLSDLYNNADITNTNQIERRAKLEAYKEMSSSLTKALFAAYGFEPPWQHESN